MAKSHWTALLKELPVATHTLQFTFLNDIKSCRALAYGLNSDRIGVTYRFSVDKKTKVVIIYVEPQTPEEPTND